jgi:hypothetical protein
MRIMNYMLNKIKVRVIPKLKGENKCKGYAVVIYSWQKILILIIVDDNHTQGIMFFSVIKYRLITKLKFTKHGILLHAEMLMRFQ